MPELPFSAFCALVVFAGVVALRYCLSRLRGQKVQTFCERNLALLPSTEERTHLAAAHRRAAACEGRIVHG